MSPGTNGPFCNGDMESRAPKSPEGTSAASVAQRPLPRPALWVKVVWRTSHSFSGNEMTDTESQVSSFGELSLSRASKIGCAGSFKYLKGVKTNIVISLSVQNSRPRTLVLAGTTTFYSGITSYLFRPPTQPRLKAPPPPPHLPAATHTNPRPGR